MGKVIHYRGEKAKQERSICVQHYETMCRHFRVKRVPDAELAKLTNEEMYKLCSDTFDRQPRKAKAIYAERMYGATSPDVRRKPLAFRWYWNDRCRYLGLRGLALAWDFLKSPVTYAQFRARKRKGVVNADAADNPRG